MTFETKTVYFHRLNGRWDWRVSVFDARKGFIFAKFVIESSTNFESWEEAEADRDWVLKSLNLPFNPKEKENVETSVRFVTGESKPEVKECSSCHGSGLTLGTPYDKPEPCPCKEKPKLSEAVVGGPPRPPMFGDRAGP